MGQIGHLTFRYTATPQSWDDTLHHHQSSTMLEHHTSQSVSHMETIYLWSQSILYTIDDIFYVCLLLLSSFFENISHKKTKYFMDASTVHVLLTLVKFRYFFFLPCCLMFQSAIFCLCVLTIGIFSFYNEMQSRHK